MGYSVTDIDRGWKDIINDLKNLDGAGVKIGLQAGELSEDGKMDLAKLAATHEFGSNDGKIPSRPFIRTSFDENKKIIGDFSEKVGDKIIAGQLDKEQGLNLIGQKMTGIIQKKIVDGPWILNTVATIKKKDSDKPLIDTDHMRQSIRHVIEE